MKITSRQREILLHIQENERVPFDANASIRNRMKNTLGLYRTIQNEDGKWTDVLTDKGRAALTDALLTEIAKGF